MAHKGISPPHKDSGPLLSLTRSTKEVTFVCLAGRRGCGRAVQAGGIRGGGGGTGGRVTMTEGVDEVKTQVTLFICSSVLFHRAPLPPPSNGLL